MMTAAGGVQVAVKGSVDNPPIDLAADQLTVEMSHDTTTVVPSHLTAAGNVTARQPGKNNTGRTIGYRPGRTASQR